MEINVVAVNALNEGNLRVTDGAPSSTGGVVNYNAMSPKLNTANAVIVPLNASSRLVVTPNCGPGCIADTTDVRGVVLGYLLAGVTAPPTTATTPSASNTSTCSWSTGRVPPTTHPTATAT